MEKGADDAGMGCKRLSQIAARSRGKPLFKSVQIPYNIEEIGQEKV